MSDVALPGSIEPAARKGPDLSGAINPITGIIFGGVIAAVLLFVAYSIYSDVDASGAKVTHLAPFLMLFVALLIALGFDPVGSTPEQFSEQIDLEIDTWGKVIRAAKIKLE